MKNKLLFLICYLILSTSCLYAQTVSIRMTLVSYSSADPDGAGPALGSVVINYELMASASGVLADGIGLSTLYQSAELMATPTNSVVKMGLLASAPGSWNQTVFNTAGNPIAPVTYGGKNFDRRTIISFSESIGDHNCIISTTFTPYAQVTYWTLKPTSPQGGFMTTEPGATVPQNVVSSDGGLTSYDLLSPNLNSPISLGSVLPVTYTNFTAGCTDKGALIKWTTGTELNADYFELQRSNKDGIEWSNVNKAKIKAKGNSTTETNYEQMDQLGGAALYRLKQYDLDGTFHYSNIIRTNCADRNIEIVIYPVPARDVLNIVVRTDKAVKTQLEIYDASGRLVKKINTAIISGNNNIPVSLLGLANGQYVIRSTDPLLPLNKKFTIMH